MSLETELQKQMIESLLEKQFELQAKLEALCELLIADGVIDESSLSAVEQDNYYSLVGDLLDPDSE
jgi:hypothetical protein